MSGHNELILPAVGLSRISPPRGGEYLHEGTAGSMSSARRLGAGAPVPLVSADSCLLRIGFADCIVTSGTHAGVAARNATGTVYWLVAHARIASRRRWRCLTLVHSGPTRLRSAVENRRPCYAGSSSGRTPRRSATPSSARASRASTSTRYWR
ncbi:hypothetical protein BRD06_04505 [Halobacteriales archaeon QS_9_67_15]|nr:MAG: hypothetical protein BRD06_04505 [Halobacteriales archaeon QS_9_67_15]